jgi:mRNA interferase MazF
MSRSTQSYVPNRGDVVRLSLDPTKGHEQAGSRPVLVLSPVEYNRRSGLALVCPITNQVKGYPYEVTIPKGLQVTGVILSDQIRSIDWEVRRAELFTTLDNEVVNEVVGKSLGLLDPDEVFGPGEPDG